MKYGNGAKVGNITVFNPSGAINAYKSFYKIFSKEMTLEASTICDNAAQDLNRLGFSWEDIESIELSCI